MGEAIPPVAKPCFVGDASCPPVANPILVGVVGPGLCFEGVAAVGPVPFLVGVVGVVLGLFDRAVGGGPRSRDTVQGRSKSAWRARLM